jgi:O-succinylhomoserine sulfhydrylase
MPDIDEPGFDTLAVRAGQQRTAEGEHAEPIFLTSSYVFSSAAEAAARFAADEPGNIYSRFTNPTVRTFEQRLAALEGGESCVATASGMSAILATCAALLKAGDHVVCSRSVFGATTMLFSGYLAKFGIETDFVELSNLEAWDAAIRPETCLLFLETPSNPLTELVDIRQLSAVSAHRPCSDRWSLAPTSLSTRPPSTWTARAAASAVPLSVMPNWSVKMSSASCARPARP